MDKNSLEIQIWVDERVKNNNASGSENCRERDCLWGKSARRSELSSAWHWDISRPVASECQHVELEALRTLAALHLLSALALIELRAAVLDVRIDAIGSRTALVFALVVDWSVAAVDVLELFAALCLVVE